MLNRNLTQTELENAYQIVEQNLFETLLKMTNKEKVFLNELGSFTKKEYSFKSALDGDTYACYRIFFSPSKKLKTALNQQLDKKYK